MSCVALTKLVASAEPFQLATAPDAKLVPFTVRVKVVPPTVAFAGDSEVIVGVAFPTVSDAAPDVPPPGVGLVTVTLAEPEVARSLAGT